MIKYFDCTYCGSKFKREKNFEKHRCEAMKRDEISKTMLGRNAFTLYKEWMRLKHRIPPTLSTFVSSKYFNAFVSFVKFSKSVAIPATTPYIKLMISLHMQPASWSKFETYQHYIDNFDSLCLPMEQASITVQTLIQLSKIFDCNLQDVLTELDADDMLKLLQAKKLSPWILLFSVKFKTFLIKNTTKEQRILIQTIVNPTKWKSKFDRKPKYIPKMKKIVKELGI